MMILGRIGIVAGVVGSVIMGIMVTQSQRRARLAAMEPVRKD